MKESLHLIEDQELALDVAYAEKPLRDLAAQAIDMGYHWAQPAYEAATLSAITAGEYAVEFYREKRAKEIKRAETISQLSEIDPGKEVFVTRAKLAIYAQGQGNTFPRVAYAAFNRIMKNARALSEVEQDIVSEDRESIRLDSRVISLLSSILIPKQIELIEGYYDAS